MLCVCWETVIIVLLFADYALNEKDIYLLILILIFWIKFQQYDFTS